MPLFDRRDYDKIHWGVHGCDVEGCSNAAELMWNETKIYCIGHADLLLSRGEMMADDPDFVARLRPLEEEWLA